MLFINILFAVLLGLFSTINAAVITPRALNSSEPTSLHLVLKNNCNLDVWVRQAIAEEPSPRPGEKCRDFGETQEVKLAAKTQWKTPTAAIKDSCGNSIKVARKPGGEVYQYEFNWTKENNRIWYNLSHINGNPFTDVARQIRGPEAPCPYKRCEPGNDGDHPACDYPVAADCGKLGDVIGFLC